MGKFQLKKPRIITKHFPEVEPHIDKVNESLETLVFSYNTQVERALQKKHIMMALSTLALIIVVGSFISPKGRADIATFYPDTCLGAWTNPRNAEKKPETTANGDIDQFSTANSAILDKEQKEDIYCGNFQGEFNESTKPIKIVIALAITNKDTITYGEVTPLTSSSTEVATTTEVSTTTDSLLLASSTEDISTSTASTTELSGGESVIESESENATSSTSSILETILTGITETINNVFSKSVPTTSETDTVIVPGEQQPISTDEIATSSPDVPSVTPNVPQVATSTEGDVSSSSEPVSFFGKVVETFATRIVSRAFAQEVPVEEATPPSETAPQSVDRVAESAPVSEESQPEAVTPQPQVSEGGRGEGAQETTEEKVSTEATSVASATGVSTSSEGMATSTELTISTSTEEVASTTNSLFSSSTESTFVTSTTSSFEDGTSTLSNFLEVLYTFDGVTWTSLGELNEVSMKYRTFEIPLSASSTWTDMSQLQIKIATKMIDNQTKPVVYLDGMRLDVLYEGEMEHAHPDFVRDTILKDETIDSMRIVTIINYENNEEEIWYMYLDDPVHTSTSSSLDGATSTNATSTDLSLDDVSSSTQELATTTIDLVASSTDHGTSSSLYVSSSTATTTVFIKPVPQKNKWFKLERKRVGMSALSSEELAKEIKELDGKDIEGKEEDNRVPDFAKDVIKKIKGVFSTFIILQVVKGDVEELWLYDIAASSTPQKIQASSSILFDSDVSIGIKEEYVFWLSKDRSILYAYNVYTKSIAEKPVPPFDPSLGERGRVTFDGLRWEVIIGASEMTFYSPETGEVFSDDDGEIAEVFRKKEGLDSVLNKEEISNLNLPVEAETEEDIKSKEEGSKESNIVGTQQE